LRFIKDTGNPSAPHYTYFDLSSLATCYNAAQKFKFYRFTRYTICLFCLTTGNVWAKTAAKGGDWELFRLYE
jgi:hypothetical protein